MELTFEKFNNKWTAEFEISADANLHIEKIAAGPIKLYQRTTGGGYDLINDVKNVSGKVDDIDLSALVYPKYIKIVSEVEPTYAAITTDGEVTEIKAQSKVVEVTSNGTTNVTPDAGYSYLSGVSVKVNVPQSGGSNIEYLDVSGVEDATLKKLLMIFAEYMKVTISSQTSISLPIVFNDQGGLDAYLETTLAIAFDFTKKVFIQGDYQLTAVEFNGMSTEAIAAIPRITKEEFYNLETA